ncbi:MULTISPECIES: hypothetical protein [Spongiibacter]|uniref:Nmad2 family putative nucleotide modification protein n=1 Tax=Spongiibacter TaxID=630749 RepID=UPI000C5CA0DF|nr:MULTISPECIES: hypothetical protein [Spongiibacter]MAY39039.1 hypothetical protein [Spongiibacter sp.]MBI58443.1 hypothetical protein [Spongiibacter sp.]MBU73881.1 hypothetical protein [Spongiibacter sp.]|tara:strand:- start:1666 stop:2292 length:627 start_codon:yes stop_codon:yes gene_type:complete
MTRIYSYVVRYDSGFAPNPFYGYCTLATCKPPIRRAANIGDWVVGSGSNDRSIRRGGRMVYAMRVTEVITFDEYSEDPRFEPKKPYRRGSRKQSCGDNIYFRDDCDSPWRQLDSFHSKSDGQVNPDHVRRDTGVNRVLVSDDFVYFGGNGPMFPDHLIDQDGRKLCKQGIGRSCFDDPQMIQSLEKWIRGMGVVGYQGPPFEWISLRG